MKLHNNIKLFADTIRASSSELKIIPAYVEKDYWITLILSQLSKSKYSSKIVFKGGTSLSKGFNIINRFSEDIDITIINDCCYSGNQIKTLIRNIEKEVTGDFTEIEVEGVSSKGSHFRKSVFEYPCIDKMNSTNKLILEINSFVNPNSYTQLYIKSFVYDFLIQTNNISYVEQYDLYPFIINVLNKNQTLVEKLVSLIRFSCDENVIPSISSKIRHFYDLYYLLSDQDCAAYIKTQEFKNNFNEILDHDRKLFALPESWNNKSIMESPLISDFSKIWNQLKPIYNKELAALSYAEIPTDSAVSEKFQQLIRILCDSIS